MGKDPFVFPLATNPFSYSMPNMTSHFSSFVLMSHVSPKFGSGGMMPPYNHFSFGGGHIPQPYPMVGGYNPPSFEPNPIFTFPISSAQMGIHSTSSIPSIHPSLVVPIPRNNFVMENLPLSSSVSFRGSQFYRMGNPLHEVPSSRGKIYPHMSNPYHTAFSS
jgi:hypothetical protein